MLVYGPPSPPFHLSSSLSFNPSIFSTNAEHFNSDASPSSSRAPKHLYCHPFDYDEPFLNDEPFYDYPDLFEWTSKRPVPERKRRRPTSLQNSPEPKHIKNEDFNPPSPPTATIRKRVRAPAQSHSEVGTLFGYKMSRKAAVRPSRKRTVDEASSISIPFSMQEDQLIRSSVENFGPNWLLIAEILQSAPTAHGSVLRTALQCSSHYHSFLASSKTVKKPPVPRKGPAIEEQLPAVDVPEYSADVFDPSTSAKNLIHLLGPLTKPANLYKIQLRIADPPLVPFTPASTPAMVLSRQLCTAKAPTLVPFPSVIPLQNAPTARLLAYPPPSRQPPAGAPIPFGLASSQSSSRTRILEEQQRKKARGESPTYNRSNGPSGIGFYVQIKLVAIQSEPEYTYGGTCSSAKQDGATLISLRSLPGRPLSAFHEEDAISQVSFPTWPKKGNLSLTIIKGDSTFCEYEGVYELCLEGVNVKETLTVTCYRTHYVHLHFTGGVLSSVECLLEEEPTHSGDRAESLSTPPMDELLIDSVDPRLDIISGDGADGCPSILRTPTQDRVTRPPPTMICADGSGDRADSSSFITRMPAEDRVTLPPNVNRPDDSGDLAGIPQIHSGTLLGISSHPAPLRGLGEEELSWARAFEDQKQNHLVFTPYIPQIVPMHCEHPAKLVESTTLAGVKLPKLNYEEDLPDCCTKKGKDSTISAVQLETVKFVGMRHLTFLNKSKERAGYLIGDGTGVGKGRQIAAIIADNFLKGRKRAIWVTSSSCLISDSRRDLDDVGMKDLPIFPLPPHAGAHKLNSDGVLFVTYRMLLSKGGKQNGLTRYQQILEWATGGDDRALFQGVLIFDEAHLAKNLKLIEDTDTATANPSKTAILVNQIQIDLPIARVVYVSATGASDPKHIAYMRRLGLWGPGTSFTDFNKFHSAIGDSVTAMEMVVMEMKSLGVYCNRHLSFEGTTFDLENLTLNDDHRTMYDASARWWQRLIQEYENGYERMECVGSGCRGFDSAKVRKVSTAVLWGAHQRFFLQLCIATKVNECVRITKEALETDHSVVIGLFTTGESSLEETLSKCSDHEELLSAPLLLAKSFMEKWFPAYHQVSGIVLDDDEVPDGEKVDLFPNARQLDLYESLMKELERIQLPDNPLDELIHRLGGPKIVAEITGRSQRLILNPKTCSFTDRKSTRLNSSHPSISRMPSSA